MLGFCSVLLPFLVSFQGFVWVFFFADLVWFLNRLVYIFSAKFCKWKKTNKRKDLK